MTLENSGLDIVNFFKPAILVEFSPTHNTCALPDYQCPGNSESNCTDLHWPVHTHHGISIKGVPHFNCVRYLYHATDKAPDYFFKYRNPAGTGHIISSSGTNEKRTRLEEFYR